MAESYSHNDSRHDNSSLPVLNVSSATTRILQHSDIDHNLPLEINSSNYTTQDFQINIELCESIKNPTSFTVLHSNIRSLSKNYDQLTNLLSSIQHQLSIIGITETKIKRDFDCLNNIQLPRYDFISQPTLSNAGGVGFYILNELHYTIRKDLSSSLYDDYEMLWVEIDNLQNHIICGVVYRHPNGNINIL